MQAQHMAFGMFEMQQGASFDRSASLRMSGLHKENRLDIRLDWIPSQLPQYFSRIGMWSVIEREEEPYLKTGIGLLRLETQGLAASPR
jgi:hypothetical protein